MLFIDCEVYQNYVIIGIINHNNELITINYEPGKTTPGSLLDILKGYIVGFNILNYDIFIINAILQQYSIEDIYKLSCFIINNNIIEVYKKYPNLTKEIPNTIIIDLFKIIPNKKTSLKEYEARIHFENIKDLPYNPHKLLTKEEQLNVENYCKNDLLATKALYNKLEDKIKLRFDLKSIFSCVFKETNDVFKYSEASLAEHIILKLNKKTENKSYQNLFNITLKKIKFYNINIEKYKNFILSLDKLDKNKIVNYIKTNLSNGIKIGNKTYILGIGGLHSVNSSELIKDKYLIESDISSFYPNIILNLNLYPKSVGEGFLEIYEKIVKLRLKYKYTNKLNKSASLKMIINSLFGKIGSKYSKLFCEETFLKITIFGQFILLHIIELIVNTFKSNVILVNTDGIIHNCKNEALFKYIKENFNFNFIHKTITTLFINDINNYFYKTKDGNVKKIGIFTDSNYNKTPNGEVIYQAVIENILNNISIENYIYQCKEATQFILARKSNKGCFYESNYLGKVARWYYSNKSGFIKDNLGNRIPDSNDSTPVMNLKEFNWNNLNYEKYISESKKLLYKVIKV